MKSSDLNIKGREEGEGKRWDAPERSKVGRR